MLVRFASAALVVCVAIALAAAVISVLMPVPPEKLFPLLTFWCIAPVAWGIWAMLAPGSWVPRLFPLWGAFLGVIAGVLCEFVLHLPTVVLGFHFSVLESLLAVLVMAGFYAALWLLVGLAYRSLSHPAPAAP
jgi:hypothetical protein